MAKKETFFEKRALQLVPTPIQTYFLCVLRQNKAFI